MAAVQAPALKPHILVVDDDDRLRGLLRRFLAEQGFLVSTAAGAAEETVAAGRAPERETALETITIAKQTMSTALTRWIACVYLPLSEAKIAPAPSMSGTVPSENSSMESAPVKADPLASA